MKILFVDPILRTAETAEIPKAVTIKSSLPYGCCLALHDAGHEVVMVSTDDYRPCQDESYPFPVHFLPSRLKKIFPPRALPFFPALVSFLCGKRGEFDMVLCGEIFGLHSLMAALICPAKTVVWHEMAIHPRIFGGWASMIWYAATRVIFSRVRCIVPRSGNARRFLSQWFRTMSEIDVEHGIDERLFAVSREKADRFVVVSQLVERKRIDRILHAFAAHVRDPRVATDLWILGDGPQRSDLEEMAARLGIANRCRFFGRVPYAEVASAICGSKALLYAGYKDNSLLTVAESIASGTPVLITASIDNAEMVERFGLGIARDEWDERELAQMELRHSEFVNACVEKRHVVSAGWQTLRLVECFQKGGVDSKPGSKRSGRPTVVFLTQNCFVQCDTSLLPRLKRDLKLVWKVFYPQSDDIGYSEEQLRGMARDWGVEAEVFRLEGRLRSMRTLVRFIRLGLDIRKERPEIVYVNATGSPWLAPVLKLLVNPLRVLWAIHDVQDHRNKSRWSIDAIYKRAISNWFGGVHLLSRNQFELFRKLNPARTAYCTPIPPHDYGIVQGGPPPDKVRFLFFGFIARYKGVDILIDAAQRLWGRGVRGFEVVIAGRSDEWEFFSSKIQVPEIFRLEIGSVPNERLPRLFGETHWVVLPYRDVTQSGPLSMALNYNRPAIVSDLPAFQEFIQYGTTGLAFRSGDVDALAEEMERAVALPAARYEAFRKNLADFVDRNHSVEASRTKYLEMFKKFSSECA